MYTFILIYLHLCIWAIRIIIVVESKILFYSSKLITKKKYFIFLYKVYLDINIGNFEVRFKGFMCVCKFDMKLVKKA